MRELVRSVLFCVVAVSFATQSFASCHTGPPTLLFPTNGSEVPHGSVTLDWTDVPFAFTYDVYFGLGQDPPSLQGTITQTQKTIFMEPGYQLTWYIVAKAPTCPDQQSSTFTFTTKCPLETPDLLMPAEGATFPANQQINFNWTAVPGSASYDIAVFDGEIWTNLGENLPATSFQHTFTVEGDYKWAVRANFNGSCDPLFSEEREIVIGADCQNSGPPDLLSPGDATTTTLPVTFEWTARPGANEYTLLAHKVGDRLPRVLTRTDNTSYTTTDLDRGTYQWWVAANYPNCADAESASRFVTIESECPTGRAVPLSPNNGAVGITNPVTFQWQGVEGAIGYAVGANIDGEIGIVGTTTATELTTTIDGTNVTWVVQTVFDEECSTTSDPSAFRIGSAPCPTAPPQLTSPANGATNVLSPVTFSWTAVPNAARYHLAVALGDGDFQPYGTTEETSIQKFVPAGAVRWMVVATSDACPELRSTVSAFVVTSPECPAATLTLTTPANGATVASPVRLAWSAVAGAEAYRVWISINGDAPVNIVRATTNEATLSLPAGEMKWYVEALRPNCKSVLSNTGEFRVSQGTNCGANAAPAIIAPAGTRTDPTDVTSPVTLQWTGVERAIGYRVWVGKNEAFSDVKLTGETSVQIQLEPGVYGWFVQALFEGCDPRPSAIAFFEIARTEPLCPNLPPSILEPAEGSTPASPVTFRWTEVARAIKYRVFASLDGAEAILLGTTTGTELTRPLGPGSVLWSVEAVFKECPSTFSPRVTFTIPQAQNCPTQGAELLSPPNGAANVTEPVDFVWSPVTGAVKYVLVAKVNDGAATPIATTEETHFIVENVPPGVIDWTVITFFAGCDPVESARSRFTVARNQACTNRRPILLIPDDEVPSPVRFQWTRVPRAIGYKLWVQQGEENASVIATTSEPEAEVELPEGTYVWYVDAEFENCPPTRSASGEFQVIAPVPCGTPEAPETQVVGQALSGTDYRVRWAPLSNVGMYEVQESTTPDFANAETFTTEETSLRFSHEVNASPVQYLYRVRGVSNCNDERGPYSDPIGVFVIAARTNNASAEIGGDSNVVQKIFLPGSNDSLQFTATADKPWLTVTPASGALPPEGIALTVTADPSVLALGTNTGTIRIQYTGPASAGSPQSQATTTSSIPMSVSLVTPVIPTGKGTPPPDSLIFPIVGHAVGVNNSLFESDIRVTNMTAQTMKYQLNFTPSGVDGTQTGSSSTIELAPGATMALDDIVASLFGTGTTSSATGMLEVRPLTTSSSSSNSVFGPVSTTLLKQLQTAASSRTYNFTPTGTFGQFIPAIRFSDFIGKLNSAGLPSILSLQQIAQSAAYRANFGFAEASGNAAQLQVRVYDTLNQLLATIPIALQAGEHRQINGMLAANGINNLTDGRVEVQVLDGNGKVTAYVSEVDNKTNDPLLVSSVVKGGTTSNRYVVPGTAFINSGFVFWVTDLRIFNAGATSTPATLTFYPQGNPGGAVSREVTIDAGEIEVLDNVIGDLFAQPNGAGGMVVITTPTNTTLTATARTYNKTSNGTYGQYIPGVTPAESAGVNDRALQILQLEQSSRFRTNIGLAETTGQPVNLEVSLNVPDLLFTPVVPINLAANEFRQISLGDFGLGSALYNARISVKVIGGTGRVTAYGSAIDLITQDPTYVPAQ